MIYVDKHTWAGWITVDTFRSWKDAVSEAKKLSYGCIEKSTNIEEFEEVRAISENKYSETVRQIIYVKGENVHCEDNR